MQNYEFTWAEATRVSGKEQCNPGEHDIVDIPAKEPTCTAPGNYKGQACSKCDWTNYTPIAAKGHELTKATCTTAPTCTVCGTTQGDMLEHEYAGGEYCKYGCGTKNPNWKTTTEKKPGESDGEEETEPEETTEATVAETEEATTPSESETQAVETNPDIEIISGLEEPGDITEPITVVGQVDPVVVEHECNPFTCGWWIWVVLALVIGIVGGWFLHVLVEKQKQSKRRSRPYTKVEFTTSEAPALRNTAPSMPMAAPAAAEPVPVMGTGISAAVHQHVGARKDQQDSYGVSDLNAYGTNGILAIVADGMGGLANGAAVSSTLVHSLLTYFRQTTGRENTADMMLDMVTQANDQINRMLQGADRSGSTLVSVVIREGKLFFLTVGDSRLYLYRKGILLQLNREHIYQEELALKAVNHIVPLQQVTGDRQAHALTSYLGIGRLTHIDRNYEGIKLEPGDRLLLASDGVFGTLSQADMEAALRNTIGKATEIMGQTILQAAMPYQDNNTALVLEYRG